MKLKKNKMQINMELGFMRQVRTSKFIFFSIFFSFKFPAKKIVKKKLEKQMKLHLGSRIF